MVKSLSEKWVEWKEWPKNYVISKSSNRDSSSRNN